MCPLPAVFFANGIFSFSASNVELGVTPDAAPVAGPVAGEVAGALTAWVEVLGDVADVVLRTTDTLSTGSVLLTTAGGEVDTRNTRL